MVFYYQNCCSDREKLLKLKAKGREFAKNSKSLKKNYSNSERSECLHTVQE